MLRVGILGAGGMGNVHARHYRKMPDVEIGFFDIDPEKSRDYADRWSANPAASADQLIAQSDFVDICLPTPLHAETALKAIAAGCAVFVEKPFTRTLAQGRQLLDTAAKSGVTMMTGQVVRFFPEFATGRRLVAEGAIGKPAAARTRRGGPSPAAGVWFLDSGISGGVVLDLAVHDFDWLRWTLGEVKHLYSRSVMAQQGKEIGADYCLTTLTFESGAIGHVEATWMDTGGFRTTFEVAGSDGIIQFDSRDNQALRTSAGGKTVFDYNLAPADDPYYQQLRAFLDAAQGKRDVPVTAYDGFMAVSIALAATESAKTGKVVVPEKP